MAKRWVPWIVTILLLLMSATAFAAGNITETKATSKPNGWDGPNWINQSGDDSVTISARSCADRYSATNDWIDLKIWREAGIFPDADEGDRIFDCHSSSYVGKTWTTPDNKRPDLTGPETFHFQMIDSSGPPVTFWYKVHWF